MNRARRIMQRYALLLGETRRLYAAAAETCIRSCPDALGGPPGNFSQQMELLHQGLVVKIYVTVARADQRWSSSEKQLAQVLVEHLWHKSLSGDALREAARRLFTDADRITWDDVVGPFRRLKPLHEQIVRLQTVILRMAHVIAEADGSVRPPESQALHDIESVLHRLIVPTDVSSEQSESGSLAVAHASRPGGAAAVSEDAARDRAVPRDCQPAEELETTLAELDALIGLENVKQEVHTLVNVLRMRRQREQMQLPVTPLSLHMVFRGNPGTGKTTVARLLARILRTMGILDKGHLVETDRSGLVAEYAGQTAPKTQRVIDQALDGILFVDEAYALAASGGDDPFGAEALQTLLKRMEDQRERLVVILAGYPRPMDQLFETNPGLHSRFTQHLTFSDYTPCQLGMILESLAGAMRYELGPAVRARLLQGFTWMYSRRDEHFGNGRYARNVLERAIRQMANRLAAVSQPTRDMLVRFEPDDFPFADIPPDAWVEPESLRVEVRCNACGAPMAVGGLQLEGESPCPRCGSLVETKWGQIVEHRTS